MPHLSRLRWDDLMLPAHMAYATPGDRMMPHRSRLRVRTVHWKPDVALWRQRWAFSELIAKGARVEIGRDGGWRVRWP